MNGIAGRIADEGKKGSIYLHRPQSKRGVLVTGKPINIGPASEKRRAARTLTLTRRSN